MIDPNCDKNVFELWREGGECVPFKVTRWTWKSGTAFLVERVMIEKWPFGKAWGRFVRDGVVDKSEQRLQNAGSFQWKLIR